MLLGENRLRVRSRFRNSNIDSEKNTMETQMLAEHAEPIKALADRTTAMAETTTGASGFPAKRWVTLGAIFFASAANVVDRMAWGNVSLSYAHSMGTTLATVGSFFTAFFVGYVIANALAGFAADRFGGRPMVTLSLLLLGAMTFCFGSTTSIALGLTIQCVMGFVGGMDYSACVRLLADAFPGRNRTTAMGLFLTSIPVGLMLPNLFVPIMLRAYGWQGVYHLLGAATASIGVIVFFTVKTKTNFERQRAKDGPRFRVLLTNSRFIVSVLASLGVISGSWGFAFWGNNLLVKAHGIDPIRAGFIVAFFGGTGLIVKPISGWIVDKLPIEKPYLGAFCALCFAASLIVFSCLSSPVSFLVWTIIVGVSAWATMVIAATLVIDAVDTSVSGAAAGLGNAIGMLGNVIVPLAIGATYQFTHSFQMAIFTMAVGPAAGVCFFLWYTKLRPLPVRTDE